MDPCRLPGLISTWLNSPVIQQKVLLAASSLFSSFEGLESIFHLVFLPLLQSSLALTRERRTFVESILIYGIPLILRDSWTSYNIIPSWLAIFGPSLFSLTQATYTTMPVYLHCIIQRRLNQQGQYTPCFSSVRFGVLWAASWWLWEQFSPLGRYGIPTPLLSLPVFVYIIRYSGSVGLDVVLGSLSHTIYQLSSTMCTVSATPPLVLGPQEPLRPFWQNSIPRYRQVGGIICIILIAFSSLPAPLSLNAPLSQITPFPIGCVLGLPLEPTAESYIQISRPIGSMTRFIVFPESAVQVDTNVTWKNAIEDIHSSLSAQYGIFVAIGVASGSTSSGLKRNELVLIGPHGSIATYRKQHLFTVVESLDFERHSQKIPVWKLPISRPPHSLKTGWGIPPNHTRQVEVAPMICLDSYHQTLLGSLDSTPSIIIVSAAFPSLKIALRALDQARILAISHGTPTFVCSASRRDMTASVAAYIDEWGRILHLQVGGQTFSNEVPLRHYGEGKNRPQTYWEWFGPLRILLLATVIAYSDCLTKKKWFMFRRSDKSQMTGWFKTELLGWSSENEIPHSILEENITGTEGSPIHSGIALFGDPSNSEHLEESGNCPTEPLIDIE